VKIELNEGITGGSKASQILNDSAYFNDVLILFARSINRSRETIKVRLLVEYFMSLLGYKGLQIIIQQENNLDNGSKSIEFDELHTILSIYSGLISSLLELFECRA
jgi:hypothetical protein